MKILVTGANGQLGRCIRLFASDNGHSFVFTDVVEAEGLQTQMLDITDLEAVRAMVAAEGIEVVVNCAAYTNVDAAEDHYELADLLNAKAPENLAVAMKEVGGLLIHISTDYVFGGDPYNTPCREEQSGTPTGVYGLTKLRGEEAIAATGCRHIIIRTAWLYSEFGKNFCKTMMNLTATKPELKVVFDQVGTPTYALDLASVIFDIVENRKADANEGIYHYSNEGVTSWYDFTQMIAKIAGNTNCDIQPCYSSEYLSPVRRPAYSVLDKKTFKDAFGIKVPYWVDSLEVCINNIKNNQ